MGINSSTGKRILQNTAYLAFGSIVGKSAMFIALILIARFFGPENFGAYNTAFSHVFVFGLLSKLGFDMAVVREGSKNKDMIVMLQNKMFALRFWTSVVALLLTIFSAVLINYDVLTLKLIIIISPIIISGGAINSGLIDHFACYFMMIEKMQFSTYVVIFRTLSFTTIIVLLYFLNWLNIYLLGIIVVASSFSALLFQIRLARLFYKQKYSIAIDMSIVRLFLKPVLLFGIIAMLGEVSLRAAIIILSKLSTNTETGYFSVAWSLTSVGALFITSFSVSVFPNTARKIFHQDFRQKMLVGIIIGVLGLSVLCVLVNLYSESIIKIFFGDGFLKGAFILSIIIWFLPMRLLSLWAHQVMECADYLYLRILVFLIPALLNFILNFLLVPHYQSLGSAYAALISNFLLLILSFAGAYWIISNDDRFTNQDLISKRVNLFFRNF